MINEKFVKLFEKSFKENWELPAYDDYGTKVKYTYGEVAQEVEKRHILFSELGVKKGDKVALLGTNSSEWAITYVATVTYGAVIVPILPDFNPNDVHQILNHSDSKILFVMPRLWDQLDEDKIPAVQVAYSLADRRTLLQREDAPAMNFEDIERVFAEKYPQGFSADNVSYPEIENSELASINYTSGTTGFSKGVMMSGNNLAGNVVFGLQTQLLKRKDEVVSFLPLSHAYGCAFEFLTATCAGAHVHFLGRVPAPKVLIKAFQEVRPNVIFSVPLIFEKIYKNVIVPQLETYAMKLAMNIPFLDTLIYKNICTKLKETLGGNFYEVIIGGAALNKEVEDFFKKINFPFTVGYGMTECAPLITYADYQVHRQSSVGKALPIMEVKILSNDPYNEVGEIVTRGENVMLGYYKSDDKTSEVLDEDGWLHTGDLGLLDEEGNLYIKGRNKSMILGSNGQNIYPEEIESKLNNMPYVAESLVVESNGKLYALVYPDNDALSADMTQEHLQQIMDSNLKELNTKVAPYEKIAQIKIYPSEFEKTPKKSIKRYLYNKIID